jgi:hypothetical protein
MPASIKYTTTLRPSNFDFLRSIRPAFPIGQAGAACFISSPPNRSGIQRHPPLIQQASFLVEGALIWDACFRHNEGSLAGTIGLLFTCMHMTLLGVLLALAPRPLYGNGDVTCFGIFLPAAVDQQIGGIGMLMV